MKDRILRLCKRLDKFMLEDIVSIADDVEETVLELLLETLIQEEKLIKRNGIYFYNKQSSQHIQRLKLPQFFQHHSKDIINLITRCFCAELPVLKVALIIEPSKTSIANFYNYYRNILYRVQFEKLKSFYKVDPKIPSVRALYDKKIYLYCYNNEVFLTDKPLISRKSPNPHTKEEMRIMRVLYYRVRRIFNNYSFTQSLREIAYEKLWMQNKTQEEKISILTELLNISQ